MIYHRLGPWKYLTAYLRNVTADPWCAGSNPGSEEAF